MQPVALVTGGGVSVGRAIARALASSGYRLVVNYRTSAEGAEDLVEQVRAEGGDGIAVQADVADRAQVERLLGAALDEYGGIDLLVNSAGHAPKGEVLELTDEEWHTGLDMMLLNVVRTCRLVTPVMEK